jgi:hypothetical protein
MISSNAVYIDAAGSHTNSDTRRTSLARDQPTMAPEGREPA